MPPAPVLLDGLVLFDNDPDTPAADIDVTALGAPRSSPDAEGRFRISALPLEEMVTCASTTRAPDRHPFRPDHTSTAMTQSSHPEP